MGSPIFNALHSRKHDHEVQLYAFDGTGDGNVPVNRNEGDRLKRRFQAQDVLGDDGPERHGADQNKRRRECRY
jgi:hypothetical protein